MKNESFIKKHQIAIIRGAAATGIFLLGYCAGLKYSIRVINLHINAKCVR
jgi:hypothetical protein